MKQGIYRVISNEALAENVYKIRLLGDTCGISCGQFVNIKLNGFFLRRPISVCDAENGVLTLIYKTVGQGTRQLAKAVNGNEFDLLTHLGNGYDLTFAGDNPLLIGGGAGIPPLYMLAKQLLSMGKNVTAVLGFNTKNEVYYEREFCDLGCKVAVTTADGTYGVKGFVTDALPKCYSYFYTCGPEPMLRAVYKATSTSGQFSFEERMGCGFGACMGCSCKTVTGYKRICKDGPVLCKEEILWKD